MSESKAWTAKAGRQITKELFKGFATTFHVDLKQR